MENMGGSTPRVKVLGESVARRIAAGEVIERPSSVVRELIDNAIDAGSKEISLYLEEGGISKIRLVDDGQGMSKEDLSLCWLPHATSKIREVKDLQRIHTLGFRGEALSSVAACSRLEISSYSRDDENCHRLLIESGKQRLLESTQGQKGTIIDVSDLFYSIPARKQFLKRAATESRLCRVTFLEKAMPFPELSFRLFIDNTMRLFLPATDLKERVAACYDRDYRPEQLVYLHKEWEDFSIKVVAANPEQHRRDRKHIQIFANKRRIDEYAFVQAVEYGFDNYLPGGAFPSAFVFIDVAPHLVDFNIHPAKREAKFHIKQKIHHGLVELIKQWLQSQRFHYSNPYLEQRKLEASRQNNFQFSSNDSKETEENSRNNPFNRSFPPSSSPREIKKQTFSTDIASSIRNRNPLDTWNEESKDYTIHYPSRNFHYHGQIFNLFLLVEQNDKLMVLDQHAAHERILYDKYRQHKGSRQELLIPQEIEMSLSEEIFLKESLPQWADAGFIFKQKEPGLWVIQTVPEFAHKLNLNILEIISGCAGDINRLEKELYAQASCKSAIKDGEVLDRVTAEELIEQTLVLPEPRCPHGRPIWFEVSRDELFQLLGRNPD